MKKRKVSLDVFEDAVLPKLQAEHKDITALQDAITKGYDIYDEAEDGTQTPVKYSVTKPVAKSVENDDEDDTDAETIEKGFSPEQIQKLADAVTAAIAKSGKAANTKARLVTAVVGEADTRTDDERPSFAVPAEVKRFGSIQNFAAGKRHGLDQDERCHAFGRWAMAAMNHEPSKKWCNEHGIELKVHSENVNTAGGYTVPEVLSGDLIDLKESFGVARRLFDRYPMTSDTLKINRRVSGLTATYTAENAAATESTMALDQVQLIAKDLMAITRVSGQLNMDSVLSWSDRLAREISYAFANKEDNCAFIGTGTSTYGGITGIVTALTNKWSTGGVPGTGVGLIKQGTSNTWATMVMADFDAVVGALPQYADTDRCVWVMHRTFYYTVIEKLIQAAGGVPAYEVRQGQRAPRPIFKGYPVEFSQVFPSTSSTATVVATLGDHSLAGAFGDRQQDSIDFNAYASVGGQSMWERNQMGVRGIERFDVVIHDVGDGSAVAGPVVGLIVG
jgi:HK97 family phage major capsid protein